MDSQQFLLSILTRLQPFLTPPWNCSNSSMNLDEKKHFIIKTTIVFFYIIRLSSIKCAQEMELNLISPPMLITLDTHNFTYDLLQIPNCFY